MSPHYLCEGETERLYQYITKVFSECGNTTSAERSKVFLATQNPLVLDLSAVQILVEKINLIIRYAQKLNADWTRHWERQLLYNLRTTLLCGCPSSQNALRVL